MRGEGIVRRVAARDVAPTLQPATDGRGMTFSLDGRIYRAFRKGEAAFFRRQLSAGYREDLFQAGLVRYWESDLRLEGYDLVLECQRVPVVSHPPEWPTAMVREAARTVARLGLELARHGLVLQDAHPWNVLFDGPRPVVVDLGSLVPGRRIPPGWMREFRASFVLPLALHRLGLHQRAGSLLARHGPAATSSWDSSLACRWFPPGYARLALLRERPRDYFSGLVRYLGPSSAEGAPPAEEMPPAPDGSDDAVEALLRRWPPGTVVDLWAGSGERAERIARSGHYVVAFGSDDGRLNRLYHAAQARHPRLLTLRVDPAWPLGNSGLTLAYADAPTRLRGDIALAVGALPRLAGEQGLTFDILGRILSQFARAAAVVEFIPPDAPDAAPWSLGSRPWYTLRNLVRAVEPYFPRISCLRRGPGGRRLLLLQRDQPGPDGASEVSAAPMGRWRL